MELEHVYLVSLQPPKAGFQGPFDHPWNIRELLRGDTELGGYEYVGVELPEHWAQVGLGAAISVGGRRVEIIDTELHGPLDGLHLLRFGASDQQATHVAAPEASLRGRACLSFPAPGTPYCLL